MTVGANPPLLRRPGRRVLRPLTPMPIPVASLTSSSRVAIEGAIGGEDQGEYVEKEEDDWITRTASTLTLARLEEKGVSWLTVRGSSTSLEFSSLVVDDDDDGDGEGEGRRRRRRSQRDVSAAENADHDDAEEGEEERSLGFGKGGGRSQSRRRLMMKGGSGLQSRRRSRRASMERRVDGQEVGDDDDLLAGPDFVSGFAEDDGGEFDEDDDDRTAESGYLMEVEDESEIRKVVMGRVGGWVDWAVGWMDLRGEEENENGEGDGDDDDDGQTAAAAAANKEKKAGPSTRAHAQGQRQEQVNLAEEVQRRLRLQGGRNGVMNFEEDEDEQDEEEDEDEEVEDGEHAKGKRARPAAAAAVKGQDGDDKDKASSSSGGGGVGVALSDAKWLLGMARDIVL